MEDMLNNKAPWEELLEVALEAKAKDPVVQDVSGKSTWGDYMLLVTASSQVHMRGIYHRLVDYVKTRDDMTVYKQSGVKEENRWILMDLGSIVINIMTEEARDYYRLEDVWFDSPFLYKGKEDQSSKSS
ncbi:MAG: ribosome silencing factor [Spirochaetaceae bacterium 4572_59]|nr:MAG: ribosome silencing factor [Spirochaetaceae bacterium 4572_59]